MPKPAITVRVECEQKVVFIFWRIKIMGDAATPQLVADLKREFNKAFNDDGTGLLFKIGDCDVIVDIESTVYELGSNPGPGGFANDRDTIVITDPRPDGGGMTVPGQPGKGGLIMVNPRNNGTWSVWKLINELGHAFGLLDKPGMPGLQGEWNLPNGNPMNWTVTAANIRTMIEACATDAVKRRINECCHADLKVADKGKKKKKKRERIRRRR